MAQATNQYYSSVTRAADKRYDPEVIQPRNFAAAAGAPTLPQLCPVGQVTATGFWAAWNNGATNGSEVLRGFVTEASALNATGETLHNVMLAGRIHRDDIPLNGQLQADLDAALSDTLTRELGFVVQGLPNLP